MEEEKKAMEAIKDALRALRKRHLLEEGAHAPAISALSKPLISHGSEWKEKTEKLETELQQCYKAQSRLSEQLVIEVAESRTSKAALQEKELLINDLQKELTQTKEQCTQLKEELEDKTKTLDLLIAENQEVRSQLEEMTNRVQKAETENKMLIDRWMLQKMQDAERLNEANDLYEEMLAKLKANGLENLARQQVDGIVRRNEDGTDYFVESTIPSTCSHRIHAHEGGCGSIIFEYNSGTLFTGGQNGAVKMWDTNSGSLIKSLYGSLGNILDLAITHDNKSLIAATSSNNLFVWDVNSAYDRTIKLWDLHKGYCTNTVLFASNCNTICLSIDGLTVFSGHLDGNLRLWDIQTGKILSEVVGHSSAVTSVSISRNGNRILSSGRDNVHNVFDTRTLELCATLRAPGNRLASNWSRSCISPDDDYVAAGSADGTVHVWSLSKGQIVSILKEQTSPILCCSWSGIGKPLASADKNGYVCTWT
ncbi:Autophagy-related protein 16 [Cardamine amara subsp. amara]|uniref:Autophagy-related protein 16 n=1 Tax=Cardamine amara subsp. amara TaxID=228776 RepID=A0ABD1ASN7_CARAN